jgi:hypothetical protein
MGQTNREEFVLWPLEWISKYPSLEEVEVELRLEEE